MPEARVATVGIAASVARAASRSSNARIASITIPPPSKTIMSLTFKERRGQRNDRDRRQQPRLDRRAAESPQRLQHHRDDHRLDAVEQPDRLRHRAVSHVHPRDREHDRGGRQDEARARDDQTRQIPRAVARYESPSRSSWARESGCRRRACRETARASSIARRRTTSSSIIAICAAGPPIATVPSRRNSSASSRSASRRAAGFPVA